MSPTKEELADEATIAQLKELAEKHEVDLEGATLKDDIVEKMVASRKVTKSDLDHLLQASENGDLEKELSGEAVTDGSTPVFNQKPIIRLTTWVRLGSGRKIPKHLHGHVARVLVAPIGMRSNGGFNREYQPDDTVFTVQTRDIYEERLEVTRADLQEILGENRPSV